MNGGPTIVGVGTACPLHYCMFGRSSASHGPCNGRSPAVWRWANHKPPPHDANCSSHDFGVYKRRSMNKMSHAVSRYLVPTRYRPVDCLQPLRAQTAEPTRVEAHHPQNLEF